jgi:hypothetical protein
MLLINRKQLKTINNKFNDQSIRIRDGIFTRSRFDGKVSPIDIKSLSKTNPNLHLHSHFFTTIFIYQTYIILNNQIHHLR